MSQITDGTVRVESGSQTIRGSWRADAANISGVFVKDEIVNFTPSGAAGRVMRVDDVAGEAFFVVTSGTLPATGDTMENVGQTASADVGNPAPEMAWATDLLGPLTAKDPPAFALDGDSRSWQVAAVVSDHELTLVEPFVGATDTDLGYEVTVAFSRNRGYPVPGVLARNPVLRIAQAIRGIDRDIGQLLGTAGLQGGDFDGVLIHKGANLSVATATATPVSWVAGDIKRDSRSSNPGVVAGWWDPANPTRINIPSDVSIMFALFSAHWGANATGERETVLGLPGLLLGGLVPHDRRDAAGAGITVQGGMAVMIGQPTISQLELTVWQNSGGNLNLNGSAFSSSYVAVFALRRALQAEISSLVSARPPWTAHVLGSKWEAVPNTGTPSWRTYLERTTNKGWIRVKSGQAVLPGEEIVTPVPQGARPIDPRTFMASGERIDVEPDGRILYNGNPPGNGFTGWLSLDALAWDAEQ